MAIGISRDSNVMQSTAKQTKRTRMTAENRRTDLIRAAIDVFSKHGFGGTTTKAVAKEAGVSEAVIFRHFATKDELYAAILDQKATDAGVDGWMEELLGFAQQGDDEALFGSLVSKIVESYRQDPQFQRLMLFAALEGHTIAKVMHERRGMPTFEFLRAYVARRQKQGAFRDCDPGAVVYALVALPTYYSQVKQLFGIDLLPLSDDAAVTQFVRMLLDGLRSGSEKGQK